MAKRRTQQEQDELDQKIQTTLKRYEREQHAYENDPLWQKMGMTRVEFVRHVETGRKNSGMDKGEWEQRLAEVRAGIETRVRELSGNYQKINFLAMRGIKI